MSTGLTTLQRTVLVLLPDPEDSAISVDEVADRLQDIGVTRVGAQRVLYHLVDAGYAGVDEWGYWRRPGV